MAKPTIRFRGFDDEWEQRKLGEVFEQTSNLVNPKEDEIELWSLTVEDGLTKKSDRYNREFLVKKDDNFKEVRPEDIVYNPMNMTLGAVGYNGMAKSVAVSGYYTTMVTKENYDTYYINTWLKSPQAIQLYRTYATGSLIEKQRVQFPTLSIIPVAFPKYEEQTKIGSYFDSLDNLITLHQRKCDETKKLKKYMLQKMFPQNGSKVPEIRFKGFTDEWEQRKLDDVVEFLDTMRKPLEGAKRISGPYPYYGASGIVDYVDGYLFDEELILLSEDGANITDRNYPVCFLASGKYWVNNHAHVLRTKQGNENNFICNSLERKDYTQYNTGMAMPKLNKETCKKIPILCPGFEEQKKIGDYFRSLDNLITLHQHKCEELKKLKKFMLQNMFTQKNK